MSRKDGVFLIAIIITATTFTVYTTDVGEGSAVLFGSIYHVLFTMPPSWNELLLMDTKQMAAHADPLTKYYVYMNSNKLLSHSRETGVYFDYWNETSLCNVAYVALYGSGESQETCKVLLTKFIKWKTDKSFTENLLYFAEHGQGKTQETCQTLLANME